MEKDNLDYVESIQTLESLAGKLQQDGSITSVQLYKRQVGNVSLGSNDVRFYDLCRTVVPRLLKDMRVCSEVISGMRARLQQLEQNAERLQIDLLPGDRSVASDSIDNLPAPVQRSSDLVRY
jgi:hypothetical protein